MITRRLFLVGAGTATALAAAGCTAGTDQPPAPAGDTAPPRVDPNRHQVTASTPAGDLVVPAEPLAASRALLAASTAVVVYAAPAASATPSASASARATASPRPSASPGRTASASPAPTTPAPTPTSTAQPGELEVAASKVAHELGIPALPDGPELAAELERLQTRVVIAYGDVRNAGGREIVPGPATAAEVKLDGLPAKARAADVLPLAGVPLSPAVDATVAAAGLRPPLVLGGPHPGSTGESTQAVKEHRGPVVGIGSGFGTVGQFGGQIAVTREATKQLPGGGIAPFPVHHMIALYGHPETPALGMMGEQPPAQAVERLRKLVDEYKRLMPDQQVMGSFEIITTVASASAGADGDYSYETSIDKIMPWVEAAEANDIYVVLDLQPGRTHFVEQAKRYTQLLERPWVGLALDPEWRLRPDGKHLVDVGQVGVDEVNEVGTWLADFVAERKLPPKVLTLHQFQTRMITDRHRLDVSRPEIQYLVHVDGQGGQGAKQSTWEMIRRGLPAHTYLGWKNFEDEDKPMLTPAQTVQQVRPMPHFISYQ